ncbi:rolling circle replication-associated protein [Senegalia massiliensis]|nr:Rep protein [Senegalia massiliensis]
MRWEIARIIDCNFDNDTKFMTLTFRDNIKDVSYTNKELKKFIKRLNYNLYKTKKHHLKYLAVWEKQKRGAIHYHIIFFDFPYIEAIKLEQIWSQGFIKINKIDVDSKDNRGRYVSKYFSKDIDEKDYKQKAFFKSQNLILPEIKHFNTYGEKPFDLEEKNIVYTKTYTRKVPKFEYGGIDISFKESTVKYTKIRKEDIKNDNDN